MPVESSTSPFAVIRVPKIRSLPPRRSRQTTKKLSPSLATALAYCQSVGSA
jgi:hypothetical protein